MYKNHCLPNICVTKISFVIEINTNIGNKISHFIGRVTIIILKHTRTEENYMGLQVCDTGNVHPTCTWCLLPMRRHAKSKCIYNYLNAVLCLDYIASTVIFQFILNPSIKIRTICSHSVLRYFGLFSKW